MGTSRATDGVRSVLAGLVLAIAALGWIAVPVATWTRAVVLDTETFTATVAPLAQDPQIQDSLVDIVTGHVMDQVDMTQILDGRLPPAQAQQLGDRLQAELEDQVRTRASDLVRSTAFATVFSNMIETSHRFSLSVVEGRSGTLTMDETGLLSLDFQPLIDRALTGLGEQTVVPERIREAVSAAVVQSIDPVVPLTTVPALPMVQRALALLDTIAFWLPWVSGVLLIAGLAIANRRWGSAAWTFAVVAAGALAGLLALPLLRDRLFPPTPLMMRRSFDLLTVDLVQLLWIVAAAAAVIAVAAFLVGRRVDRAGP